MRYLSAIVFAVLFFSISAQATPITIGDPYDVAFSAITCHGCFGSTQSPIDISLQGVMTIVPTTGQFYMVKYADYFVGQAQMITALTGTLTIACNGVSGCQDGTWNMVFAQAPRGDGSYIGSYEYINFTLDGMPSLWTSFFDSGYSFLSGRWVAPIGYRMTRVPEVPSMALLPIGLVGLGMLRRRQIMRS